MDSTTSDRRAELVAGLRELADWFEQHPDMPAPRMHILNSVSEEELAAIAAAVGVEPKPVIAPDEDRPYNYEVDLRFGPVNLHSYHLVRDLYEERSARTREADKIVRAAVWVLVCDAGNLPTSTTYTTEQAARQVLAMHATACTGGHTVHLVSPVPTGELVQA